MDALRVTAATLRCLLDEIERERERRDPALALEQDPSIRDFVSELAPTRFPRQAASSREIEDVAVARCEGAMSSPRTFLAEKGFARVRRSVRGSNVYLYKYRFRPGEQPYFVRLGGGE